MTAVQDLATYICLANFYKKHEKFDIIGQIQYRKKRVKKKIENTIDKINIDRYVLKEFMDFYGNSKMNFTDVNINKNSYILTIYDDNVSVSININRNIAVKGILIVINDKTNPFKQDIVVDDNFVYWGDNIKFESMVESIINMIKSIIISYLYSLIEY